MNNDNKVETAIAGLNCWANYATASCSYITINLFINSDAILNRDALWSIQGKIHYLKAAIVRGVHHTEKILR